MRVSKIAQAAMKRVPRRETAEATDVAALLTSVLELHKPKLDRHNVSASTRNDDNATAVIYPEQMRQVFSNLLLNAIDAMPKGGKVFAKISKTQEWVGTGALRGANHHCRYGNRNSCGYSFASTRAVLHDEGRLRQRHGIGNRTGNHRPSSGKAENPEQHQVRKERKRILYLYSSEGAHLRPPTASTPPKHLRERNHLNGQGPLSPAQRFEFA